MRRVRVGQEQVPEYYHRVVFCHLIGFDIALPLDAEPVLPGEGEVRAAMRLLERVFRNYPRFFDAVVGDAQYLEAPLIRFCLGHNKHVVAVLKENNPSLLEDARGLIEHSEPELWQDSRSQILAWDIEGFRTDSLPESPLRVLHTEERRIRRIRMAGTWQTTTEQQSWWWATTIPCELLPTRPLWGAAHARWDIENDLFNMLVNHWHLDHCYKHDPIAILNFVLTLLIAYTLMQTFYHRNLKPQRRPRLTLIALTSQLYLSLGGPAIEAPWIGQLRQRSPPH